MGDEDGLGRMLGSMPPASDTIDVLLIGGGAREHAMARALHGSARLGALYTTHPENPGLIALAQPVDVPVSIREIYRLQQFIEKRGIGLVVIGPEEPLAEGFADKLASPTCRVFGPGKDGARIEGDKAWAKTLMRAASIPAAEGRAFTIPETARAYVESRAADDPAIAGVLNDATTHRDPADRRKWVDEQRRTVPAVAAAYALPRTGLPVVKAAGLAKGKGVILPGTLDEAIAAIDSIMVRRDFGDAGHTVVLEERLEGREVSVLAIVDGHSILVLPAAQDHKRLRDGDEGPNTGGMGAFCPAETLDEALMARIEREVLVPAVDTLRREGIEYRGVLYAGLMLTPAGPKVLEFNARFGDPECQVILPRLTSDFLELVLAACDGRLDEIEVSWDPRPACCVVLASEGYPDKPRLGVPIHGIADAEGLADVHVFHAGTRRDEKGAIVTAGGRVLSVVALGETLELARVRAYEAAGKISFAGMQFRTDIGVIGPAVKARRRQASRR